MFVFLSAAVYGRYTTYAFRHGSLRDCFTKEVKKISESSAYTLSVRRGQIRINRKYQEADRLTQDFCGQPVHKNPSVGLSKINNTKCMKVVRAEIVFARECRMCALCWIIKTSQYLLWFMGDAKRGSSQCDLRYFPFTKANADIHKLK